MTCYPAPHAAKPPMRENKIRAARQRRTIVLRSKRQCVIVPRVKDARSRCMPKNDAQSAPCGTGVMQDLSLAWQTKHARRT
nr:hypothetical protein [uncultured Campylobacter sp.]